MKNFNKCVDRSCDNCSTDFIQAHYQPLEDKCSENDKFKEVVYHQWELVKKYKIEEGKEKNVKRWIQKVKKETVNDLVLGIAADMDKHTSHVFGADYQHEMEKQLMNDLPIDQCVAVMDFFSENVALEAQDEVEAAHWTAKQITLHLVYLVRHAEGSAEQNPILMKESLIILSGCLLHNAEAMFVFKTYNPAGK